MKSTIYVVLTGEEPKHFVDFENAEMYAVTTPGAELQDETFEMDREELQRAIDKGLIYDRVMGEEPEQGNDTEAEPEQEQQEPEAPNNKKATKAQLLQRLEELEAENQKLRETPRKPQKIDFEKAAEVYRRKGELLKNIGGFKGVLAMISTVSFDADEKSPFDATNAAVVFRAGSSSYNVKDILSITNIDIVKEVQALIVAKLHKRIGVLQNEVESLDFI